jgi:hypothetical protein
MMTFRFNLRAFSAVSLLCLGAVGSSLLVGCDKGATTTNAPAEANTAASTNTPTTEVPKAVDPALKTDAYEYYGLENTNVQKFSVTQGATKSEGTTTFKLISSTPEKATYESINTGALQNLGTVQLELTKEGIKATKMDSVETDPNTYEIVSGLTKGKKWGFKIKMGSKMNLEGDNEVTGTETVTTPVGTYKDALVVKSIAKGIQEGKPAVITTTVWLVKGKGQVKTVIENNTGGTKTSISMEEAK